MKTIFIQTKPHIELPPSQCDKFIQDHQNEDVISYLKSITLEERKQVLIETSSQYFNFDQIYMDNEIKLSKHGIRVFDFGSCVSSSLSQLVSYFLFRNKLLSI